jgi:hypothetical protein
VQGHEVDHSPPSSAKVKNGGAIPPLPSVFMAWCLINVHQVHYHFYSGNEFIILFAYILNTEVQNLYDCVNYMSICRNRNFKLNSLTLQLLKGDVQNDSCVENKLIHMWRMDS